MLPEDSLCPCGVMSVGISSLLSLDNAPDGVYQSG